MSQRHDLPNVAREGDSVATLSEIVIGHDGYIADKWEQYLPAYEAVLRGFIDLASPSACSKSVYRMEDPSRSGQSICRPAR